MKKGLHLYIYLQLCFEGPIDMILVLIEKLEQILLDEGLVYCQL